MASSVQRVIAALLISSLLVPGVNTLAARTTDTSDVGLVEAADFAESIENSDQEIRSERDVQGSEDEKIKESFDNQVMTVEPQMVDASLAGVSVVLDQYFAAVGNGELSVSEEVEVERIVSTETDAKAAVLDQYENLGIVVVDSYLNVRVEPHSEGRIIGKMVNNTACNILEEVDGWYRIQSGEVSGYISAQYVLTGDEAVARAMEDAKLRVRVNTKALNVRKGPGVEYEAITQITSNERYDVLQILEGWVEIALGGSETAYVSADYVEIGYSLGEAVKFEPISAATQFRINVVDYALQFLGNPYVWGGTNLWTGADCSGYVQSVMATFGITLPRVSWQQAGAGTPVSLNELQPGDLVFYGTGGVVNHVAMYIGNGQIVHAISETRGIGITSMWVMTPMGYRNVIGE